MKIVLEDGKYTILWDNGGFRALRYGEPWRDLTGDKMLYLLCARVEDLQQLVTDHGRHYEELRKLIDGGSESMTHEDAKAEVALLQEAHAKPVVAYRRWSSKWHAYDYCSAEDLDDTEGWDALKLGDVK